MKKLSLTLICALLSVFCSAQSSSVSTGGESEITLKTATGDIYGTLNLAQVSKPAPVVLIIAGSGPTDRNGNSQLGVKSDAYKMISAELAKNGIYSVRFDKRGIAASADAGKSEAMLRFDDYVNDVVAWVELLKSDKRFSKIYILGHSEGSLIGMIAAGKADVAGYISVAGLGRCADKIIKEQLVGKLPPSLESESNRILDSLVAGKTVANVNPNLMVLYRPSVQPYMISWMKYDPAVEIKRLKVPVMIVQGKNDIQVSVTDASILSSAKPDAKLVIIEKMNHVLKDCEPDMQSNMATYRDPMIPLNTLFVDELVKFLK